MKKKDIHKLLDPKTGKLVEELDYNDPNVGTWTYEEAKKAGLIDNPNRPHVPEEKFYSDNEEEISEEDVWKTFSEVLEELGYEEIDNICDDDN